LPAYELVNSASRRIAVIGRGGSAKSTFADRLGARTTLDIRLSRADTVEFFDPPRRTCLLGTLRRWARHREQAVQAAGCPERRDLEFLSWIWRFRRDSRQHVLEAIAADAGAVTTGHDGRVVPRRRGIEGQDLIFEPGEQRLGGCLHGSLVGARISYSARATSPVS